MYRIISVISREFVYGGHLLSLGATSIVLTVILLLSLDPNSLILIIPYLISQIVYTYNHYREINVDLDSNPERANHLEKQRAWISLFLLVYVISLIVLTITTNVMTLIIVFSIVIGGILYTDYFKTLAARYFAGFKNFYTSIFWSLLVFIIPFYYGLDISSQFIYLFAFVFLRFIVSTIFFDLKDIDSDGRDNLKTFGVLLGKKRTIYFLQILNIISLFPILLGILSSSLPQAAFLLLITGIYGLYYLSHALFLEGKSLRNLSYMVVDAEYILWAILAALGRVIF